MSAAALSDSYDAQRKTLEVAIDDIVIGPRHRPLDDAKVIALATSIREIGLQTPPSIFRDPTDDYTSHLVTGHHRLAALRSLGAEYVHCLVVEMDTLSRELWEIDENLARAELTPDESAVHVARRKALWLQRAAAALPGNSVSTKVKRADGVEQAYPREKGFAQETAELTGHSKQWVNKQVKRGEAILLGNPPPPPLTPTPISWLDRMKREWPKGTAAEHAELHTWIKEQL